MHTIERNRGDGGAADHAADTTHTPREGGRHRRGRRPAQRLQHRRARLLPRQRHPFDYGLGVSAGAANITSYLAGQRGRPLRFYTKYCPRPEYMSLGNFLRDGSYLGLDYIYGTLMNEDGEDPLDYDALVAGGVPYRITVTDALSGMPKYLAPSP